MMMVRPVTVAQKTKGGIIMPDTVLDDVHRATTVGRVLAMGNLCYKHPQFQGDVWCKVGDFVSYGKFDGIHYLFKGVKVMLIQDKDVRMVLENPQDIDPNFNLANY
jgi:co-chaperonin GroES (HSP10)